MKDKPPTLRVADDCQVGKLPDPTQLLDGLQTLWSASHLPDGTRPFNLSAAYQRAKRSFIHNLRNEDTARRSLKDATKSLDPFVRSWSPTGIAHNDFYDDQMLVLPDGRIALVDFEEAGPADPMLDVGNFLAHLRWASCFGREGRRDGSGTYYEQFRYAALERFRWALIETLPFVKLSASSGYALTQFVVHRETGTTDWKLGYHL